MVETPSAKQLGVSSRHRPSIAISVCGDGQGTYQSIHQTGISVSQALGPGLLTAFVLPNGTLGWTALATLFAGAALALPTAVRWAERSRPATSAAARPCSPVPSTTTI